jgi:hypothetical protein
VVNAHLTPLFADAERARLVDLGILDATSAAREVLASGARRALRELIQDECLKRLTEIGAPLRTVPFMPGGAAAPEAIASLAQSFGGD